MKQLAIEKGPFWESHRSLGSFYERTRQCNTYAVYPKEEGLEKPATYEMNRDPSGRMPSQNPQFSQKAAHPKPIPA